ncbi:hypothetical protein COBT_002342, partial [Conglomerata obtusa]
MNLIIFFYTFAIKCSYTELHDPDYNLSLIDIATDELKNTQTIDNTIILRNEEGNGSLIKYKSINKYDEWSFEVDFIRPPLKYPEKAGIFLFYTNSSLVSITDESEPFV